MSESKAITKTDTETEIAIVRFQFNRARRLILGITNELEEIIKIMKISIDKDDLFEFLDYEIDELESLSTMILHDKRSMLAMKEE